MSIKLSEEEIKKRLVRLRNLENLHKRSRKQVEKLRKENIKLKKENAEQKEIIETLLLRIDELERKVFGQKGGSSGVSDEYSPAKKSKKKKKRKKSSYRRSVPDQIDKEEVFQINCCPDCCSPLKKKTIIEQYIEDILLPSTQGKSTKEVIKEIIEKGWCKKCQKWKSGKEIQPQQVMLGNNVKLAVLFANYILQLSLDQTQNMLKGMYNFDISDGEIINILEKSKNTLFPEYETLKTRIRGQPGNHMDETSWQEGKEKCHAWVMTGTETEEAVFEVGKSRGKRVAEKLRGDSKSTGITDAYSAYKNLFDSQQQCWEHLKRTAKDLSNSPSLPKKKRKHCRDVYIEMAKIYEKLLEFNRKPFDKEKGQQLKKKLLRRVKTLMEYDAKDPKKLKNLRERLKIYEHALFTCLEIPGIPPDNNKAERKLRRLVLKRKNSFGTKTEKGSIAFSVNMSVLSSLWWTDQRSWFPKTYSLLA